MKLRITPEERRLLTKTVAILPSNQISLEGLVAAFGAGRMVDVEVVHYFGNQPNLNSDAGANVLVNFEQAGALVTGLEAAKPPTGDEQIRRQRELYSQARELEGEK